MTIGFKDFWYVIAESDELKPTDVLSRMVLEEDLVCFRGPEGQPVAFRDRCLHRCGRLSAGSVRKGLLRCPYHGWVYDKNGTVVEIPSMGSAAVQNLGAITYPVKEMDGYIYVRLSRSATTFEPFKMGFYKKPGWGNVRLQNLFESGLTDCVENFIDVPHTAFVHQGIFRSYRARSVHAKIQRENGRVDVMYQNERRNLGSFNRYLNPRGKLVQHTDSFLMPNITHVRYALEGKWQYVITSQSVPLAPDKTLVYTDISYQFGHLTPLIARLIRRQAQKVINQDIRVLNQQMQVIKKYGRHFYDTPSDLIHRLISEIHDALHETQDPRNLDPESGEIEFFV